MVRTLTLIAAIGALAVAALAFPIGALVAGPSVTAWEVAPAPGSDATTIATNREIWLIDPPDWYVAGAPLDAAKPEQVKAVLSWYGNAGSEPQAFIWIDETDVIHPAEMPELAIVLQDYAKGKQWKASFVQFFIPRIAGGAALTGLLLLGLWAVLKARAGRATP